MTIRCLSRATLLASFVLLPSAVFAQPIFETIHVFAGSPHDGDAVFSSLVEGPDGALYGTAQYGGTHNLGTVFRLTRSGGITLLYSFRGGSDGALPTAALLLAHDGFLYGTTVRGGTANHGTVFRLAPDGSGYQQLHTFAGFPGDGSAPYAPLIQATDGNLYGVTSSGGALGAGTVYRLTPGGTVTTLKAFGLVTAEQTPFGALVQASDGHLYGTTRWGGIYRLTLSGGFALIHAMDPATEGGTVDSALVQGLDGELYGTARQRGPAGGGTVFRVNPSTGALTVVHAFTGGDDGDAPEAGLIVAPNGDFYGTTVGAYLTTGRARVFMLSGAGTLTPLQTFEDSLPFARLLLASDGWLYGTTAPMPFAAARSTAFRITTRRVMLDRTSVAFGITSTADGLRREYTPGQDITVMAPPEMNWVAAPSVPWLTVFPQTGTGSRSVVVSLGPFYTTPDADVPSGGTLEGAVVFRPDVGASATLQVSLSFYPPGSTTPAFGVIDTPLDGEAGLTGSIAVTGWALDDLYVDRVAVCRDAVAGESASLHEDCGGEPKVFVGHATFVDGARPDVAQYLPQAPMHTRAGWGYLLLTNFLPNGGSGTFTLSAYAHDREGHASKLGSRTIGVDNTGAIPPFGTIDTPGQGETVSGIINNFGWVLARAPFRADPPAGGTVTVYIDGVPVGSPTAWGPRSDLTALFPRAEYPGVDSAAGVFTFDTRMLANGLHTIAWVVSDNAGNSAGVGSRYFRVINP